MGKNASEGEAAQTRGPGQRAAVLGYGDEGRAHALRLRAAGFDVVVAVRPGGMSWVRALGDGFRPCAAGEAVRGAEIVVLAVPEPEQPALYSGHVAPHLRPGTLLVFTRAAAVSAHALTPDRRTDVVLVTVREDDDGVTRCRFAVHRDATGKASTRAVAYARAVHGALPATTTTFAEETTLDLLEAARSSGGIEELLARWESLIASVGHEPDEALVAYYERLKAMALASGAMRVPPAPRSSITMTSSEVQSTARAPRGSQRGVA